MIYDDTGRIMSDYMCSYSYISCLEGYMPNIYA